MLFAEAPPDIPSEAWISNLWREQQEKDPFLHTHSSHVAQVSSIAAAELGLADDDVTRIQIAAQFHDVGKLKIPHAVLYVPRRLTDTELDLIRRHSVLGEQRIKELEFETSLSSFVADVARAHHERFDGSGYPDRLVGNVVSLPSRIVAAADVYSALWERRSYKPSMSHAEVMRRLREGDERMSPEMFDPDVLAALRSAQPTIKRLLPD